jgi:pimeloyl-ACP methyl ester carboxylesterase
MIPMSDGHVHYARNGSVRLAYRIWGDNDPTLVWIPGWISNVDMYDTEGLHTSFPDHLGRQTRLIAFDKRGTGLSDPTTHVPPLDERMDDLRAVMDAADAQSPALLGVSEGGPMSILFAATYPERVKSMVLYGTLPRFSPDPPDYLWGLTRAQLAELQEEVENDWGNGALADFFCGELANIPGFRDLYGRMQRSSASPTMAWMLLEAWADIDVRPILDAVRVPTLVLGRDGDRFAPLEASKQLADAMPNADFRELPPGPHALFDDELADAVLDFVCGEHEETNERVLSTVLFTDIVSSTELLSAQGDARWRQTLDAHDRLVDRLLTKYGGRRAKHTGDGIFALFDGPTKAARCGLELIPALAALGIRIRAGVHVGECEKRGDEWSGMAVHVGARISAMARADEVLTSRTVRDLSAGSTLRFESLGPQQLKGIPEDTEVYRVSAA